MLILVASGVLAQKGTAPSGNYPPGYPGDMWTGVITAIDEKTRQITITHVRDGQTESFTGVVAPSYVARRRGLEAREMDLSKIVTGSRGQAYYLRDRTSTDLGKWTGPRGFPFQAQGPTPEKSFHLVFLLDLLDDNGKSTTGTVTATNEDAREITLSVPKGGGAEEFVGEVIQGLHMRQAGGQAFELKVSQVPLGTRITIFYTTERKKVAGKWVSYRLIYRFEPPRK